jgi:osmotically-inducible protein OsmY
MSVADEIVKEVRARFEHEPRINLPHYPVHISFSDGELTLAGEVGDIAAKKLALELAAAVPGVSGIIDRLRVAPAQRMGDGAIRDHVRDALLQEPVLENCTLRVWDKNEMRTIRDAGRESPAVIEVSVDDGVVTLNGQAPSLAHKRMASVLAWWVPGSRDVVNGLEVIPPEEDSDDDITDVVRLVLEKNPFVDATQIHVSTQNAVVTLAGLVTNDAEKKMAESDVWYVFGVDRVINTLAVRE